MDSALRGHQKSLELAKAQEVFAEGTQGSQELPGVPREPPLVLSHTVVAVL